jgi:hypothetical protein
MRASNSADCFFANPASNVIERIGRALKWSPYVYFIHPPTSRKLLYAEDQRRIDDGVA